MMYWVRFAMVSVGVFFLLYVALSALLAVAWQWIKRHNLIDSADALFILRISPLSGAAFVVLLVAIPRSEEHTSELQSQSNLVCRLLLEKKKQHNSAAL